MTFRNFFKEVLEVQYLGLSEGWCLGGAVSVRPTLGVVFTGVKFGVGV